MKLKFYFDLPKYLTHAMPGPPPYLWATTSPGAFSQEYSSKRLSFLVDVPDHLLREEDMILPPIAAIEETDETEKEK